MFGISYEDLLDKNKIKIIDGIAGSGNSTQTVNQLRALNESEEKKQMYDNTEYKIMYEGGLEFATKDYKTLITYMIDHVMDTWMYCEGSYFTLILPDTGKHIDLHDFVRAILSQSDIKDPNELCKNIKEVK